MTDDVRKLLGGYATGTLSEEEKKILFDAALQDDGLFAALADEQALKDLLDDSAARAQILRATEEPRFSLTGSMREWFDRPKAKVLVATGAVLIAVIGFKQIQQVERPAGTREIAQIQPQERPVTVAPRQATPAAARSEPPKRPARPRPAEPSKPVEMARTEAPPVAPPPTAPPPSTAEARGVIGGAPSMTVMRSASAFRPADSAQADTPQFQRVAGTSNLPVRYELLRRDDTGEFRPVPPDFSFTAGDFLRVRVTSNQNGAVGVSSSSSMTVSSSVVANTWTEVPSSGGIALTPDTTKLVLAFSPVDTPVTSNLIDSPSARTKQAAPASVTVEIPIRQRRP